MTDDHLNLIESRIGLPLPAAYRRMLIAFPIPGSVGTTYSALWDDADEVIEMNDNYHRGYAGGPPWPKHFLFIGDDGSACPYLLDLSQDPPPVLHLEHGDTKIVLHRWPDIDSWMREYLDEIGYLAFEEPKVITIGQAVKRLVVLVIVLAIGVAALALWMHHSYP